MANAEDIATRLAYEFLRAGQYSASTGPVELPRLYARAAMVDEVGVDNFAARLEPFSGLQVQSVGFEDGPEEPKVHLYLTRGSVHSMKALPNKIDDVPVATHKMGAITIRPNAPALSTNRGNVYERKDRICCGTSCGPTSERGAGTLGAIVTMTGGSDLFLLSNNHVFAGCNHVPQNQPILAPSNMDGRPDARAPHEIGRHHAIGELRSGDPLFVKPCDADVALARATNPTGISSWQGDSVNGYDTPTHFAQPTSLIKVKKFGRTTGLTYGEIEARVNTPMPVSYQSNHFKGVVWFTDVWTIRARMPSQHFALPGDSGSLVVSEDASTAVGLVFAGNPSGEYAWMIPMATVISSLGGLQLVGGHGL